MRWGHEKRRKDIADQLLSYPLCSIEFRKKHQSSAERETHDPTALGRQRDEERG